MAETSTRQEIILEFPLSKLEAMHGFSLDFGKFLYYKLLRNINIVHEFDFTQ